MPLEFYVCAFTSRMAEECIYNVEAHDEQASPQENEVPQIEQYPINGQIPVVPPPMTDGEIRAAFINLSQAITSKANNVTSQVQVMTSQVNREVGPQVPQHSSTMASRLRDFTRMNPHMFFQFEIK